MFGTTTTTLSTLATREIELTEQKRGVLTLLKAAEQTAGEALADGEADRELAEIMKHKTKLTALDLAIATVRSRRPAIIAEQFAEQARGVRATAENLKRQLSGITTKTSRLLKQLSEIEGVEYTESILCCESSGVPNHFLTPKSEVLRIEIQTLEGKADEIEARTAAANGYVDIEAATDNAAVIMAALTHPSQVPTAESITNWLAATALDPRVPGRDFGSRPRRVRLVWANNGVIDANESYVFVAELARRMESPAYQTINSFDLSSATFKAAV